MHPWSTLATLFVIIGLCRTCTVYYSEITKCYKILYFYLTFNVRLGLRTKKLQLLGDSVSHSPCPHAGASSSGPHWGLLPTDLQLPPSQILPSGSSLDYYYYYKCILLIKVTLNVIRWRFKSPIMRHRRLRWVGNGEMAVAMAYLGGPCARAP